jgi:Protein of unknown function (DUF2934)
MARQRLHTVRGSDSVTGISSQSARIGRPGPENQEEIAALAHALWQARGCPNGSPEEDWFQAKQELAERSGRQNVELQAVDGPILTRQSGSGAA